LVQRLRRNVHGHFDRRKLALLLMAAPSLLENPQGNADAMLDASNTQG